MQWDTYALRRASKNVGRGVLESKTSLSEGTGDEKHPDDLDGGHDEDGDTAVVLEGETDEKADDEGDVGGKHVLDELLDVVEDAAAFLDGVEDGGEVIVSENDIRGLLGDVRAVETHGNTDISVLQRGTVVDTITSHGNVAATAVQSLNHSDLGLGRASGNDKGKLRHGIELGISEMVEIVGSHDHSAGNVLADESHALRRGNDGDVAGNGTGSLRVVTSKHVHGDTGLVALLHTVAGLGTGRIVDTDEAVEGEVLLEVETVHGDGEILREAGDGGLAGESEDTETETGHGLHVLQDGLGLVGAEGLVGIAVLHRDTGAENSLDSALGEHVVDAGGLVLEDDGHLLDLRVEGELSKLVPLSLRAVREGHAVPVESGDEDLERETWCRRGNRKKKIGC